MTVVRRIGGLLLVVAAVLVWFAAAPDEIDASEHRDRVSSALDSDRANNLLTEGAPQQSVVNGWTARDLLVIQAQQNNDLLEVEPDLRPGLLLLLGVTGLGFLATTTESSRGPLPQAMAAPGPLSQPQSWPADFSHPPGA